MALDPRELPIDIIDPDPDNPNQMPEDQYRALVATLRKHGFTQNVIVRPSEVQGRYIMADGHHRLKAARELGIATVPAVVVADKDAARSMMLSMNNIRGEINLSLASNLLKDLHDVAGWTLEDLQVTGFSHDELQDLLAVGDENPDDILSEGVPQEPIDDKAIPAPKVQTGMIIELEYTDVVRYKAAKKALKKASAGGSLADGLDALLRSDA